MTTKLPTTDVRVHPILMDDAQRVWNGKTERCKHEDHYDIAPQVSFFKDGELIASVICDQGRDGALAVVRLGTAPTKADIVVIHMDAHVTQSPTNPATGEPWGPGEMQKACDTEGACSTGLLTDCIASQAIFRSDGHIEMLTRMYHGHEKAGGLHWAEPDSLVEGDGDGHAGGYVSDVLREAMADEQFARIIDSLTSGSTSLNHEVVFWLNVCGALKCMVGVGAVHAVVVNPPSEELRQLTQTSMSPENVSTFLDGPLGPILLTLGQKWGLR